MAQEELFSVIFLKTAISSETMGGHGPTHFQLWPTNEKLVIFQMDTIYWTLIIIAEKYIC